MERGNRLLLMVAAAAAVIVLVQFALISVEASTYLVEPQRQRSQTKPTTVFEARTLLPVVLMHGMGDAAGNGGMRRIQSAISEHLGVYVASVQLGASVQEDVEDSFFVKMNGQVEMFAKTVQEDPRLKEGFNAAGFSQGNLLIRAYIERYNDPPVRNFISMHGPLAGVSGLPRCSITNFICKEIDKLIGEAVYTSRVQERIAQANYFRDPLRIDAYLKNVDFLPDINNEKTSVNQTYKDNFVKLENLVLVRAEKDTQIYPKQSEWFGAYRDGDPFKKVLEFNETKWYTEDLFGLRTLHEAGKVHFLTTEGDHLQFSTEFLLGIMDKYFQPHRVSSQLS